MAMVATELKSAESKLLNLLQIAHVLRAVCALQLQSLNMDASFLDRNVNEGFSGTPSCCLACICPPSFYVDIDGLMHADFFGTTRLLLLTRHAD